MFGGKSLAVLLAAAAQAKEIWYDVTWVDNVNPTGQFERPAIGLNGTWPPPPISAFTNETLTVHVTNRLDKATSIHHHGMLLQNASQFDGALGVTQCGIPINSTFTYNVPLQNQEPGTYWYHAHNNGEYVDGLRAPFIVHPTTPEPHAYDEDITIILGDWYSELHSVLLKEFLNLKNPTGAEPVPQTALMYFAQNDQYLPGYNDMANLNFVPGRTYRLRVINTSAFAMFYFYIDGHQMRVIEADAVDTEEYPADYISLGVAQRYSVLVTALETTDTNYYMHADFNPDMFDVIPDGLQLNYTSNVIYTEGAPFGPQGTIPAYDMFPDTELVPVVVESAMTEADVTLNMTVYFETMDDGTNRGTFNQIVWNPAKTPNILSAMTMGNDALDPNIYSTPGNTFVLDYNQTVDLVIWNTDGNMHPFHLHGHKFQIMGRSYSYFSDDPAENPTFQMQQANPMRRDTIQVPGEGYVIIRFRSDNPGSWFFHCHIEWHLESGLAATFIEAPLLQQQWLDIPTELTDQCAALGLPTSGNAVGLQSVTDMQGLKVGPYPQNNGWHAKGIAAMAMCCLTALLGVLSVVWYTMGNDITEEEHFEEVKAAQEAKAAKRAAAGPQKSFFSRFTTK